MFLVVRGQVSRSTRSTRQLAQFRRCGGEGEGDWESGGRTAFGGELARIVLAIHPSLAGQNHVPLMVLDEIPCEIGGCLGLHLGQKLGEMEARPQIEVRWLWTTSLSA